MGVLEAAESERQGNEGKLEVVSSWERDRAEASEARKEEFGGGRVSGRCRLHPTCSAFNAPRHPNPDDLRGEDEGLCQDAEEQVQVKAVLHQTPPARIPARAVGARSRELGNVSHTPACTAAFPQLPFLTSSSSPSLVFFFFLSSRSRPSCNS